MVVNNDPYIGSKVAFNYVDESWMKKSVYECIGSSYLIGVIKGKKKVSQSRGGGIFKYIISWMDTKFQKELAEVDMTIATRDRDKYIFLQATSTSMQYWSSMLKNYDKKENVDSIDHTMDSDCDEAETMYTRV